MCPFCFPPKKTFATLSPKAKAGFRPLRPPAHRPICQVHASSRQNVGASVCARDTESHKASKKRCSKSTCKVSLWHIKKLNANQLNASKKPINIHTPLLLVCSAGTAGAARAWGSQNDVLQSPIQELRSHLQHVLQTHPCHISVWPEAISLAQAINSKALLLVFSAFLL